MKMSRSRNAGVGLSINLGLLSTCMSRRNMTAPTLMAPLISRTSESKAEALKTLSFRSQMMTNLVSTIQTARERIKNRKSSSRSRFFSKEFTNVGVGEIIPALLPSIFISRKTMIG
jgi:hypothetical protein